MRRRRRKGISLAHIQLNQRQILKDHDTYMEILEQISENQYLLYQNQKLLIAEMQETERMIGKRILFTLTLQMVIFLMIVITWFFYID